MTWRYEFVAAEERSVPEVLESGQFKASDLDDAKSVLVAVFRNRKVHWPTPPDAFRLVDPKGHEIWRARLAGSRKPV